MSAVTSSVASLQKPLHNNSQRWFREPRHLLNTFSQPRQSVSASLMVSWFLQIRTNAPRCCTLMVHAVSFPERTCDIHGFFGDDLWAHSAGMTQMESGWSHSSSPRRAPESILTRNCGMAIWTIEPQSATSGFSGHHWATGPMSRLSCSC